MPLSRYTTQVSVDKTVGEIQGMLARSGAKSIMINYEDGQPVSISFLIPTVHGDRGFQLMSENRLQLPASEEM